MLVLNSYDIQTVIGEPIEKQIKLESTDATTPTDCLDMSNYDVTIESNTQASLPQISVYDEGRKILLDPLTLSHGGVF